MHTTDQLARMNADELRQFAARLIAEIADTRQDNTRKQLKIDQLTHEMAILKRWKFAARSEHLHGEQRHLFEETVEADLEAIGLELQALQRAQASAPAKDIPKRAALPASLPRTEIRHEPEHTTCACGCQMKRIGEDIAEKLDYTPGVFSVERHIRGKWVCTTCHTITQAPVPAQIIDKGIPTSGLLAQVLVAKFLDHLPLYRQEGIFERSGLAIPRSTLAQWVGACGVQLQPLVDALREALLERPVLHADETPVAMLAPGKGKTHRAYVWTYGSSEHDSLKAVIYEFAGSRAGSHARTFLEGWRGTLVCDDFSGYKALFAQGVTEAGCLAHARRKFHELWVSHKSALAEEVLGLFRALYDVERLAGELDAEQRYRLRQLRSKPITETLRQWLVLNRQRASDGTAIARAIDYSLNRWTALTRFLEDGAVPVDNNWIENRIRPIALGRSNWLFAGSLRGGQRAAAAMSLIQSAKLNGHDPYHYLKDVLDRLPTQPASRIDELLPHRWTPKTSQRLESERSARWDGRTLTHHQLAARRRCLPGPREQCEREIEHLLQLSTKPLSLGGMTHYKHRLKLTKAKCRTESIDCYRRFQDLAEVDVSRFDLFNDWPAHNRKVSYAYEKCGIPKPPKREVQNCTSTSAYGGSVTFTNCY